MLSVPNINGDATTPPVVHSASNGITTTTQKIAQDVLAASTVWYDNNNAKCDGGSFVGIVFVLTGLALLTVAGFQLMNDNSDLGLAYGLPGIVCFLFARSCI